MKLTIRRRRIETEWQSPYVADRPLVAQKLPSNENRLILWSVMSPNADDPKVAQAASSPQWIRLIVLYIFIPLALLVCGGDSGWWQAWLYSFLIFTAGVGGRIWAERRHPGLMAERQNIESIQNAKAWDKVLAPLMALSVGFPMVIVAGLDYRYNWSPELPLWLSVIGFILISLGYAFAAWAFAENRYFSSVVRIQKDRGHVLCDSGPYRFVRHPGYAGNIPPLFGIVLALGSLWTLIPAAVAIIITVIRTVLEDQTLQQELPGYGDYTRRVRYRLIPGIY
ncbi:MAG: isoprenylcysteine carboxylmethyltransferase family protein [Halieaceae bacterium]|nr:isoprenylcysteine carboxylmethyltransferase family protein [Halieaceae bacterium]